MGMQLVETITVGSGGAASIEFTGIPSDGVDLMLVLSARNSFAAADRSLIIAINNSTADKTARSLIGTGSSVLSPASANVAINAATTTANTFTSTAFYFTNYSGGAAKSFSIDSVNENNATAAEQMISAVLWNQTAAITALKFSFGDGNFVEHSTASLYKIN